MDGASSALDLAVMYRYLESLNGELENVTVGEVSVPLAHRLGVMAEEFIASGAVAWSHAADPLDALVSAAVESDYVLARVMQPLLPSLAALIRHSALARAAPFLCPKLIDAGYPHIAAALDCVIPVNDLSLPDPITASYVYLSAPIRDCPEPCATHDADVLLSGSTHVAPTIPALSQLTFLDRPDEPPSSHLGDLAPSLPRLLSAQVPGGIPGMNSDEEDNGSQKDAPRKPLTPAAAQPQRKPFKPRKPPARRAPRAIADENADAGRITKPKRITKRRRAPDGDDEDADPSFIPHNKLRYGVSRTKSAMAPRNASDGVKIGRSRSAPRKPLAVVHN